MKNWELISRALLGLILLLGGFDAFQALHLYRLQQRLAMVQYRVPMSGLRSEPRATVHGRLGTAGQTHVLVAPEITTCSGREAQMKTAPLLQANSISLLGAEAPALH